MKVSVKALKSLVAVLALLTAAIGVARAAEPIELSQAALLVATDRLAGSPYEEIVLLVAPIEQGGHVGFIVNRPTKVKLQDLFPEHAPSRKVLSPIYVGGPVLPEAVIALARKAPKGDGTVIALMPGLVAVLDRASVDRVIETTPNEAHYFVGMVIWAPGELAGEIRDGAWRVRPASADAVLAANPAALWQQLVKP
ncbi:MAG TPA: YqgE/AlgH family protein [Burkholderiales bacterium]|nr:YqgE/AlgH family protein [Burkholderiales bacterium]